MSDRRRSSFAAVAFTALAALALTACGSDATSSDANHRGHGVEHDGGGTVGERVLAGIVRDPAPAVDGTTLPSLTNEGTDVVFRGQPGGLKAVYFGYTNCPDVCPTTMSDWTVTLRRLPEEIANQVDTVMVTVDPERDNDLLTGYVQSFVPDAEAAGTLDADRLAAAAEPFGVSYDVTTNADGEVEVAHSGFLYLVGDDGKLLVTWPFGTSSEDMAADVEQLFEAQAAAR